MTPAEVEERISGTVFGPVRFVASTGSTNSDVLAAARAGEGEGLVLVADHQTAGRGRRGRSWAATAGSALLASVLLKPQRPGFATALLSPAAALAVCDACIAAGADVRLKWPNDVIAGAPGAGGGPGSGVGEGAEAKLAGVLAEAHTGPGGPAAAAVVGFGVNLRSDPALGATVSGSDEHEEGFAPLPPTTLEDLTGHRPDRNRLLVSVLMRLDGWYRRLQEPCGQAALVAELRRRSATLGRRVRLATPAGIIGGTAEDLTGDGRLVVATTTGPVAVEAGDCGHLR